MLWLSLARSLYHCVDTAPWVVAVVMYPRLYEVGRATVELCGPRGGGGNGQVPNAALLMFHGNGHQVAAEEFKVEVGGGKQVGRG